MKTNEQVCQLCLLDERDAALKAAENEFQEKESIEYNKRWFQEQITKLTMERDALAEKVKELERWKETYRYVAIQNSYQGVNISDASVAKLIDDEARRIFEEKKSRTRKRRGK